MSSKSELVELLRARSLKYGEFQLSSGTRSYHYLDVRLTSMSEPGSSLIGEAISRTTWDLSYDAVGGPAEGAIAIALAVMRTGRVTEGFWVRRETKGHGTESLIEGRLEPGVRVLVVDDVATSGQSLLTAVRVVLGHGCEVAGVACVVDRLAGARELLAASGVQQFRRVLTIGDLLEGSPGASPARSDT